MVKIGLFGIGAAFMALILKKENSEYASAVALAAGIIIFSYGLARIIGITEFIEKIAVCMPVDNAYVQILFKMLGIAYMGELAADICRDSGYNTIAAQIEFFAKVAVVALSLPCLSYLLDVVEEFL